MLDVTLLTYSLALLSGVLVGSISFPLVMSGSVMFGLTLLHSILGGALLGVFLNTVLGLPIPIQFSATLTSIFFSILTAELIQKGLSEDTATAFSVASATTLTIISSYYASSVSSTALAEAWSYVMGSSSIATIDDLFMVFLAILIVAPLTSIILREIRYISFDEDGAKAMGINIRLYRYTFYSLVAIAAATLSSTIGVLVTHVVLAVPGAISVRLTKRSHMPASYLSSVILMLCGYLVARQLTIPPSGGVGLLSTLTIFLLFLTRER